MTDDTGRQAQDLFEGDVESSPSGRSSEENGVTLVDLLKYEFSPPGPMGWTAKEYEKMIEKLQRTKGEEENGFGPR